MGTLKERTDTEADFEENNGEDANNEEDLYYKNWKQSKIAISFKLNMKFVTNE